jgi:hypothetical protein
MVDEGLKGPVCLRRADEGPILGALDLGKRGIFAA